MIFFFAFKIRTQKSKSGGYCKYKGVQEGNSDRKNTEEIAELRTGGHGDITYQIKMVDAWPNPITVYKNRTNILHEEYASNP